MRAVVVEAPQTVAVHTVPDAGLSGPDGAVVAVEATAICGSDLHFYDGDLPLFPVAIGHEAVGRIVEVGADVQRFRVGDRVLVASVAGCGHCQGCATLDPVRCDSGPTVFGAGQLGGAQADLLAVPAADFQLLAIPEGMDDDAALLLTDNLSTGWVAAQRANIEPGATVAVLGLGAVGLCAVRSALALGAGRVLAVDPVQARRDRAEASGAEPVAVATADALLEANGGRGLDAVIDAVAVDESLDTAIAAVRNAGTVSVVGVHDLSPYPFPMLMGVFRSLTLNMTTAPVHRTWADLVPRVLDGTLDTSDIFTHTFALDDAADAYRTAAARSAECCKVRLMP